MNPFLQEQYGPGVQATTVDERVAMIEHFDAAQCRAALRLRDLLQKTVRDAVLRRLRQLAREKVA